MKRLLIALLCILFISPFGFIGCKDTDSNVIRVNEVTHSIFYAPLYIAINNGYFEEYDIEIELTNGGGADKSMASLVSNSADIGLMGPEAAIYVAEQGKQDLPVVFGQLTKRDGSFLIGRENIENFTWADMAGKEVLGGRQGGVPAMTLEYVIEKNGVSNCTINYDIAFDNLTGAFVGGTGDFVTAFEPVASTLEANGQGHILASIGAEAGEMPFTAFMANKSYIESNKETVKNFLRAIVKGYNFLVTAEMSDIVSALRPSFDGTSDALIQKSIEHYVAIDAWNNSPVMTEVAYNNLIKVMKNAGKLTNDVPFSKIVDNSLALEILK
ncbi:MAG: ABC transporter substrate-binding protein [Clostridiales bacterium]|nr:ABC transporter substrate-binding protein [Clostridiales bacterium]